MEGSIGKVRIHGSDERLSVGENHVVIHIALKTQNTEAVAGTPPPLRLTVSFT